VRECAYLELLLEDALHVAVEVGGIIAPHPRMKIALADDAVFATHVAEQHHRLHDLRSRVPRGVSGE
jgi:hypothetical protein